MGNLRSFIGSLPQLIATEEGSKLGRHCFVLGLWLMATLARPLPAVTVPSGFTDSILASGIPGPTAMEFAPDGRLFVCQKAGQLRIIKDGALLTAPFMTVTVDTLSERGLLGVAFDPNFSSNHFLYVYYTAPTPSIHNRVSRFTASGDSVVPGSEFVLLNLNTLSASDHNGGAIHFGPDGRLYIAAGDNTISANAQSLGNLLGKISRLNPDGTIPTDNPFFNTASGANRAIWALGFRNPFTFAFQPGTGRLFINDVGFTTWEEINEGVSGANYGWPTCEGACIPANGFKNPLLQYGHIGGNTNLVGCAIVGGVFYNPPTNNFPLQYVGSYFFADYCNGWIRRLDTVNSNTVSSFASGLSSPVDLKVGADGCLYCLTRGDNAVYKFQSFINPPNITAQPANQTVTEGTLATFTAGASGAGPLSFQWQRDSTNISGAISNVLTLGPTLLAESGSSLQCIVTNFYGSVTSNPALLLVITNQEPTPIITQPAEGSSYAAGDSISFAGVGADPEEGPLPPGAFSWTIEFHHDSHTHPFLGPLDGVTNGIFLIPTQGETSPHVWYRLELTVTDSLGRSKSVRTDIIPLTSTITLDTSPPGLQLTLDGQPLTAPATDVSVVGLVRSLGVRSPQPLGRTNLVFVGWSDGAPADHDIAMPVTNTTYTAQFLATPFVTLQPVSLAVTQSAPAVFTAQADGAEPLRFQWRRNGLDLPGETNATLTIASAQPPDAGDYSVDISNSVGTTTSVPALLTVLLPPSIILQPHSLAVTNGSRAAFSVTADGTAPLSYQWLFKDDPLPGQNTPNLLLSTVSFLESGGYTVIVANMFGAVTSTVAALTVEAAPVIANQPQSQTVTNGDSATFTVTAFGGAPLSYQWYFQGTNRLAGETNETLNLTNSADPYAGEYSVQVANAVGTALSDPATLTVLSPPSIAEPPLSQSITNGATLRLHVAATGTPPLLCQWRFNGYDLPGETNNSLTLSQVTPANAGDYFLLVSNPYGAATSSVATVSVLFPPFIASHPQSVSATNAGNATFTVEVTGSSPIRYQWFFQGTNALAAETNAVLALQNVSAASAGDYAVEAVNDVGGVRSESATLTVLLPPVITSQLQSQSIAEGNAVAFTISANGTAPLSYEWRFNGDDLGGQTGPVLFLNSVTTNDAGTYAVLLTNPYGFVLSSEATLTVLPALEIAVQPRDSTVTNDTTAAFAVTARGRPPFHYQWIFQGTNVLDGQTNSTLDIPRAQASHAGTYTVRVGNAAGELTSDAAVLTVLVAPSIMAQPESVTVTNHSIALFQILTAGTAPLHCQWFFNGSNLLAGATNDTFVISNALPEHAGTYAARVSNVAGVVTSPPASLTVLVPPAVTSQPQSRISTNGATTAFTVSATGTSPLAVQWFFQGTNALRDETNATLILAQIQPANEGDYTAQISNSAGTVTSLPASLSVLVTPFILSQPASLIVTDGLPVNFTVTAGGTAPLRYQWYFNRTNALAGQTGPSKAIAAAHPAHAGTYSVRVDNPVGSITSAVATLTISPVRSSWPARAALQFDGVDDYVEIPDSPALRISGPITVEAWIFRSAMGVQHSIVEKYGCAGLGGYVLRVTATDKLLFGTRDDCSNGSSVSGATTLLSNTWYHVAGTWDGAALRVFVNGVLDAPPFPTTRNPKPGATPLRLGARGNDLASPFNGILDEVRVWNAARSAADLQAAAYGRLLGTEPGLAAYWRLDDGLGLTAADATANANTGTLTNGPIWVPSTAPLGLPGIATTFATDVTSASATLGGAILLNTESATAFFQWGASSRYGQSTPALYFTGGPGSASLAAALPTLTPGVTYHFRLAASNEIGANFGPDVIFTTPTAPAVATSPASNVASSSATLNGALNPNAAPTTAWFEWGLTSDYGKTTVALNPGSGTSLVPVASTLTGLSPGATHHFRLVAFNAVGTNYGADEVFSTPGLPAIITLAATAITTNAATLNASASPNGSPTTAFFQWGATTNYTDTTPPQDVGSGLDFVPAGQIVSGWQPGTIYHFRAAATNLFGAVFGADQIVATLPTSGETALLFDGLNDQVVVPDNPSLRIIGPITVEAWIRRSVMGVQHAILEKYGCIGDAPFVGGYVLRVSAENKLMFRTEDDCSNGSSANGATSLQSNVWYHVAGLWDGSQIRVYVNGMLDGATVTARNPKPGNTPLRIGERGNTLMPMSGAIDEVRLWNVARTQPELQANLNHRLTGAEPGLVAYWRLDEGTGFTTADATGHGNTGTLLDGPLWITGLNFSGQTISQRPSLAIHLDHANNSIQLSMTGLYGTNLVLEVSTNLNTWATLRAFSNLTGPLDYSDILGPNPGGRFYRLRVTP